MKEFTNYYCKICGCSGKGEILTAEGRDGESKIPDGWTIEYKELKNGGRLGSTICSECNPCNAN